MDEPRGVGLGQPVGAVLAPLHHHVDAAVVVLAVQGVPDEQPPVVRPIVEAVYLELPGQSTTCTTIRFKVLQSWQTELSMNTVWGGPWDQLVRRYASDASRTRPRAL
jgi:hypothetical protein